MNLHPTEAGDSFWLPAVWELVKIIFNAIASAGAAIFIVNRTRAKSDFIEKRIDDICVDIRNVADLTSRYWLERPSDENMVLAAQIQARIRFIDQMRRMAGEEVRELVGAEVNRAHGQFFRACTGDNFGVHNREPSVEKASALQYFAAAYITTLRSARFATHHGAWFH